MPPSVSIFFSSFLLTAAPKGVSDSEMSAGAPKTGAWCGVVVMRHFARRKVTHRLSAGAKDRGFWRRLTVTRQQSLAAMQAAARKVKGDEFQRVKLPELWYRESSARALAQ